MDEWIDGWREHVKGKDTDWSKKKHPISLESEVIMTSPITFTICSLSSGLPGSLYGPGVSFAQRFPNESSLLTECRFYEWHGGRLVDHLSYLNSYHMDNQYIVKQS